jgi:hypothetical protein
MLCLHYFFFAALIFAQRALCAAAILFLPAAAILRRGLRGLPTTSFIDDRSLAGDSPARVAAGRVVGEQCLPELRFSSKSQVVLCNRVSPARPRVYPPPDPWCQHGSSGGSTETQVNIFQLLT